MNTKHPLHNPAPSPRPAKKHSTSPSSSPEAAAMGKSLPRFAQQFSYFGSGRSSSSPVHSQGSDGLNYTTTPSPPGGVPIPADATGAQQEDTRNDEHMPAGGSQSPFTPLDQTTDAPQDMRLAPQAEHDNDVESSLFIPEEIQAPKKDKSKLESLSEEERHDLYASWWVNTEVHLKDLRIPEACKGYPAFAQEILIAYCMHVTLIVKIWANYDAAIEKLFQSPSRIADCGKIYLSPKQRTRVMSGFAEAEFGKVQLEVGTAFQTLANAHIQALPYSDAPGYGLDVEYSAHYDYDNDEHEIFHKLLFKPAIKNIAKDGVAEGRQGLTLHDLDAIAQEFVLKPKTPEQVRRFFEN